MTSREHGFVRWVVWHSAHAGVSALRARMAFAEKCFAPFRREVGETQDRRPPQRHLVWVAWDFQALPIMESDKSAGTFACESVTGRC